MGLPRLIVILDWSIGEAAVLRAVSAIASAHGPSVAFQQRAPGLGGREFLRLARLVSECCSRFDSPLFINERLEVALLLGAHLHLPSRGPDVADVRPLVGRGILISVAVHDPAEAERARGADLALVSPVFGAMSKPGDTRSPLGIDGFSRLASVTPCPSFALGGVTPESASRLRGCPAAGLAAVSGVLRAERPEVAAGALLDSLS